MRILYRLLTLLSMLMAIVLFIPLLLVECLIRIVLLVLVSPVVYVVSGKFWCPIASINNMELYSGYVFYVPARLYGLSKPKTKP